MKLPVRLAQQLLELAAGASLPMSQLRHPLVDALLESGILYTRLQGRTRKTLLLPDPAALAHYLHNHLGIADLQAYLDHLTSEDPTRAQAVAVAADSKLRAVRTFPGFLVNSLTPLPCILHGAPYTLNPTEGTFTFVYDYAAFVPPPTATIIGIENPENFRHIRRQVGLFADVEPLFVSRYPQSKDLLRWLQGIPNPYLHFGDFDFAGINIYWNEFARHLQGRARLFLPEDLEARLMAFGNRGLYARQRLLVDLEIVEDEGVRRLAEMIERVGKGLEQEGYLG
jgi:hypothetical protein